LRELREVIRLKSKGVRIDYYMMDAFWFDKDGGIQPMGKPLAFLKDLTSLIFYAAYRESVRLDVVVTVYRGLYGIEPRQCGTFLVSGSWGVLIMTSN